MKLSNKAYDIAKYVCLIFVPAFIWLLCQLGGIWGFDPEKFVQTIAAFATFAGMLLGFSTYKYKRAGMEQMFDEDLLKETIAYEEMSDKDKEEE